MVSGLLLYAQQPPPPQTGGAGRGQGAVDPAPGRQGGGGRGGRAGGGAARKRVLAWADTRNGQAQHESVGHALAVIERLGYDSGMWDTFIRTDSNIIAKAPKKTDGTNASGGPNLSNVDAIFFMGHREVLLEPSQKEELLAFVREGKGFVAAHVGLTAFESWPEFGELIGARFDQHPINGPGTIINERPDFPATKHFPPSFAFTDEFYQPKLISREKVDVLLRLDLSNVPASPSASVERRLSAGVGQDVRQGTRVLRLVRALVGDVGHPRHPAAVLRGDALGAGADRRGAQAAPDDAGTGAGGGSWGSALEIGGPQPGPPHINLEVVLRRT